MLNCTESSQILFSLPVQCKNKQTNTKELKIQYQCRVALVIINNKLMEELTTINSSNNEKITPV